MHEDWFGPPWFAKGANKNGGRAVRILKDLGDDVGSGGGDSDCRVIYQPRVPNPLLFDGKKCHIKRYQLLSCDAAMGRGSCTSTSPRSFQLHHNRFSAAATRARLSTVDRCLITTLRSRRIKSRGTEAGANEDLREAEGG